MEVNVKRCKFHPSVGKIPWKRSWQPTPGYLPGKSYAQRSLAGYGPWGHKRVRQDWAYATILCILKSPAVSMLLAFISLRSDYKIMINIFYEWALVFWWIKVLSQKGNNRRAKFQKSNLTGTSENQVTLQSRYFWRSLFCDN